MNSFTLKRGFDALGVDGFEGLMKLPTAMQSKAFPLFTAALSFLAVTPLTFAESVATVPVGAMTINITGGTQAAPAYSGFSLPLIDTPAADGATSGRIASLTATTITVTSAGWTSGALSAAAAPYAMRVVSGTAAGTTIRIFSNTSDTLTFNSVDLTAMGIATGDSGDRFEIIPIDTLDSLFGSTTLLGGTSPNTADVVFVPAGSTLVAYYFSTTTGHWRNTTLTLDKGTTALLPNTPVLVLRRSSALTLTLTGRVPSSSYRASVTNAFTTYMDTGFPTDTTIADLSLQTLFPGWRSATSVTSSDVLYVFSSGIWKPYFYNGTIWRDPTLSLNRGSVAIPAGTPIRIYRFGTNTGSTTFTRGLPYSI